MRTVRTATAVQVVYSSQRGSQEIEHLGSTHDEAEPEALKAAAQERLAAVQGVLDLGAGFGGAPGEPMPITASRMSHLLDPCWTLTGRWAWTVLLAGMGCRAAGDRAGH